MPDADGLALKINKSSVLAAHLLCYCVGVCTGTIVYSIFKLQRRSVKKSLHLVGSENAVLSGCFLKKIIFVESHNYTSRYLFADAIQL